MNSIWIETSSNQKKFPKLKENIETDVCVIGAGITGITTAYLLTRQGMKVALLEKNEVCTRCNSKHHRQVNKPAWFILHILIKFLWRRNCKSISKYK